MKVIVTGGLGLQGAPLATRLHNEGHYVKVLDNASRGGNNPTCDLKQAIDLRYEVPNFEGYDAVFHLAARVGGLMFTHGDSEARVMMDNLRIDSNVLEASLRADIKRFIYASSSEVYPTWKLSERQAVLKETDGRDANAIGSGYGWAKVAGEVLLEKSPIPNTISLRLFNVYGPGERYLTGSHVIPELVRKTLFEQQVEIYGDGRQRRPFTFVDDAVDAYVRAFGIDFKGTINIGNPETASIKQVAERIISLSESKKKLHFDASKPSGTGGASPDQIRAKDILGWTHKTSLDQGLKRTIAWMSHDYFASIR